MSVLESTHRKRGEFDHMQSIVLPVVLDALSVEERQTLLEDPAIDAISIAAPNHWHTLMAIWACQAGKDVYVEKPCSHNLWEGRQLVRAVAKYNRIVQHGTQTRSDPEVIELIFGRTRAALDFDPVA